MFPDACIVQTHRDPLAIIGSYCSMMVALMSIRERVDPRELGPVVLEYLARSVERAMAARERLGSGARFVDVDYRQFVARSAGDGRRDLRRVRPAVSAPRWRDAMAPTSADPQNKHGTHDYALEKFGLTAAAVASGSPGYIERFDLPVA